MKKKDKKWLIHCPNCKSNFDVSGQIKVWYEEFIENMKKAYENALKHEKEVSE